MSLLGVLGVVVFTILALLNAHAAVAGRNGTMPPGSALGMRSPRFQTSREAWDVAHEAAWPIHAMAAAVAAFHALGCVIAEVLEGGDGIGFVRILVVMGILVMVLLRIVATRAAMAQVARLGDEEEPADEDEFSG